MENAFLGKLAGQREKHFIDLSSEQCGLIMKYESIGTNECKSWMEKLRGKRMPPPNQYS